MAGDIADGGIRLLCAVRDAVRFAGVAMTAPIRGMAELVDAIRARRDELNISHETIDNISGLQSGYTSKLLGPNPLRGFSHMSLGAVLGALGICLHVVDDPEQRAAVEGRWQKRKRPQRLAALLPDAKREEMPQISAQSMTFEANQNRMSLIGKIGGEMSGKTRRRKAMKRRELQRKRSHAARLRWAKQQ